MKFTLNVQRTVNRFFIAAAIVMLVSAPADAFQSNAERESISPQEFAQEPKRVDGDVLEDRRQETKAIHARLGDVKPNANGNDLRAGKDIGQETRLRDSITQEFMVQEFDTSRKMDELGYRIKELIRLNEQRRQQQKEMTEQAKSKSEDEASATVAEPNLSDQIRSDDAASAEPNAGIDNAVDPNFTPTKTQRILRDSPDKFALANSLFFAGEYELASDILKQLSIQQASPDRSWNEYQVAACLRRLGELDESKTILRSVAEREGGELIGVNSRWWLEVSDRKQTLRQELDLFEEVIEYKKEQNETGASNELVAPESGSETATK